MPKVVYSRMKQILCDFQDYPSLRSSQSNLYSEIDYVMDRSSTSPSVEAQWPCPLPSPANPLTSQALPTPQTISALTTKPARQAIAELPAPSFRNVSACNRCRIRKHRCDQRLPRCESCEKAQVRCVGYDPLTKQEVPRSYVAFLETRVNYLTELLLDHGIDFKPALAYDEDDALCTETERPGGISSEPNGIGATKLSQTEQAESMSRKRKLSQCPDEISSRQVKRLSQLNVLLTEIFNGGCSNPRSQDRERKPRQTHSRTTSRQQLLSISRGQRSSWSPQSFQSMDHSDGRTSPESASPSPSNEQYPYSYHDTSSRRGMSLFGVASVLDSDNASRVYESRHSPSIDPDLGFQFNSPEVKYFPGSSLEDDNPDGGLNITSYRLPHKAQACSPPEQKFDIAADLLRGRMERGQRVDKERAGSDLLDEFLVDWAV